MSRYHGYSDPFTQAYPLPSPPRRQRAVTNNLDNNATLADARNGFTPWISAQAHTSYSPFGAERTQTAEQPAPSSVPSRNAPRARCPSTSLHLPPPPSLSSASTTLSGLGNLQGSSTRLFSTSSSLFGRPSSDLDSARLQQSPQAGNLSVPPPLSRSRHRRSSQIFQAFDSSSSVFEPEETRPNPFRLGSVDAFFTPPPLPARPEYQEWRPRPPRAGDTESPEPFSPSIDTRTVFADPPSGSRRRRTSSSVGFGSRVSSLAPTSMDLDSNIFPPMDSMTLDLPPLRSAGSTGLQGLSPLPDLPAWDTAAPSSKPTRRRRQSSVHMEGQSYTSLADLPPLPPSARLLDLDSTLMQSSTTPIRRQRQMTSASAFLSRDRSASSSTSASQLSSPMSTDFFSEGRGRGQSFTSEHRSSPATSVSPSPPPSLPRLARSAAPSPQTGHTSLQPRRLEGMSELSIWDPVRDPYYRYPGGS